jgi:hypothetical protein
MKVCPSCKTQYTDDSLAYCLQDGTPLVPAEIPQATAILPETETVIRNRERPPEVTSFRQSKVPRISPPPTTRRSQTPFVIALLAGGLLVFGVIIALGVGWVLLHPKPAANNTALNNRLTGNNSSANNSSNSFASPTPSPSPSVKTNLNIALPTTSPSLNTTNSSDAREVASVIENWRNAITSLDSNSLMENYADTVDYYRRGSVSADFVRNDKLRAFNRFTTIQVTITNLSISVEPSGDRATAEFDKAWVFRGDRTVTGKTRSQLRFSKINGRWLITGEKDLSVYYVNH